ncbi:hypothetical protein Cme02nite_41690 [Catellatospora methionotrophica]|uniref:Uncharacterized protein n=1 Tax=Catellatospora methionotrophica TaxID=121620 RepID=A0A8J3L7I3_9ACTN|nr:hypothetical protein Cme02nite_41690 [Catellatospora methionotrophica]
MSPARMRARVSKKQTGADQPAGQMALRTRPKSMWRRAVSPSPIKRRLAAAVMVSLSHGGQARANHRPRYVPHIDAEVTQIALC